ncbi:sensor histidine kinase [Magnetococcales bacterium HHB-1]
MSPAEKAYVLVIDDDWLPRTMLTDLLTAAGYRVETAEDGQEGWEKFSSAPEQFALIITDVHMPHMTGLELVQKIRQAKFQNPIIIFTSSNEISLAINAINQGANDYLLKDENITDTLSLSVGKVMKMAQITAKNRQLMKDLGEKNDTLKTTLQELQESQKKLVQSEKMASLGRLVAGIAHEINTPIGIGITAVSHLKTMAEDVVDAYKMKRMKRSSLETFLHKSVENSKLILTNLERTAELVKSFKMVSADQMSLEHRQFELKEYLTDVFVSLKPRLKTTPHQFKMECPEGIVMTSYPGPLAQVVTNMVINALNHAFPDKEQKGLFEIVVQQPSPDQVAIHFKDNGRGIPKKNIEKIFDPFFTTNRAQGNTGLGLNIVFNTVNQTLGGEISCISEEDKGTEFIVQLPVNL